MTKNIDYLHRSNEENQKLTRESLETALLLLLKKKDFDKLSITEIINKAGVSRNSFYRNYGSKENLVNSIVEGKLKALQQQVEPLFLTNPTLFYRICFQYFESEKGFYQHLLRHHFKYMINDFFYSVQDNAHQENNDQQYYRNIVIAQGASGLICHWLAHDCPQSAEKMTQIALNIF